MTETPMRRPTIKDVAERAKVSLKTVSRVINNEPSVLQGTRARVLHAIAELDYEPDQSARNLRSGTQFVIGLVYDNPNPYHIIGVQNGVLAACKETGFDLQIHPVDSTSPLLAEELVEFVQRSRLAGLVLTAPMSERADLVNALAARGVKLVRIIAATEDPEDGLPCVYVDDRDAAYEITEHLIQLGHQRIGFLVKRRSLLGIELQRRFERGQKVALGRRLAAVHIAHAHRHFVGQLALHGVVQGAGRRLHAGALQQHVLVDARHVGHARVASQRLGQAADFLALGVVLAAVGKCGQKGNGKNGFLLVQVHGGRSRAALKMVRGG